MNPRILLWMTKFGARSLYLILSFYSFGSSSVLIQVSVSPAFITQHKSRILNCNTCCRPEPLPVSGESSIVHYHAQATTTELGFAREIKHSIANSASMSFKEDVTKFLTENNIVWKETKIKEAHVLAIGPYDDNQKFKLGLHIIPCPESYEDCINPKLCKDITDNIKQTPFAKVIHLHEDVWQNKNKITKARILAKLNRIRNRWYARNTVVERIPVEMAMEFLEEHHLWGSTRAKFNYGLFLKNKSNTCTKIGKEEDDKYLIAVATFSPRRHVNRHGSDRMYRSHELIRYCAKKDEIVVGGITKLLAKFCREFAPDDIVTCIDRDFGDGGGWQKIGFEKVQVMPPLVMTVGRNLNDSRNGSMQLIRKYLVGAGVGTSNNKVLSRKGRPGIDSSTFSELNHAQNHTQATQTLLKHDLFPVFDTGVERRMLIVQRSKLKNHADFKREELGLQDIIINDDTSVCDIWNDSSPSFPNHYYSPNRGIELLLQAASSSM